MNTAKVTQLRDHLSKVPAKLDKPRLEALSRRFHDQLPPLLDGFFTAADDFLFQWAEKTMDGMESSAYFEHLRALRLEKGAIREAILTGARKVTEKQLFDSGRATKAADSLSIDELTLMEDETLERGLAIDSFANRVIERSGDEWLAFRERMGFLVDQKELKDVETPFNARDFGEVVFDSLELMQCPIKTTLMLFRLFDQKASAQFSVYYQSSNRWLAEEGILPNLKLINARSNNQPELNAETFEQLGSLLAQRALGQSAGNSPQGGGGWGGAGGWSGAPGAGGLPGGIAGGGAAGGMGQSSPAGGPGVMIDSNALQGLVARLTQIQSQTAPTTTDVAELKVWTQSQAQAVTSQAQGSEEAGTISLVAMLFEYILDDEKLSPHMKQLMARMQIPIIKVALLDKTFFTDADHAARLLLNRMARAAAGWEPSAEIDGDVLLDGMEAIVSRLNHDFEADLGMFDTALEEFGDLKAEYEALQSARVAVVRSEEDEKLEAHVNLDRARLFIKALLQDEEPQEAARFLLERHWYRLMKGIYKSQGESKAWKNSARIARELMWSLQPNVQFTQPKRFQKVVPGMLAGLADGLKALGIDKAEQERLIDSIRDLHGVDQQVLSDDVWDAQTKLNAFEERTREAQAIVDEAPPLPVDEPVVQHKPADLTYYMDRIEELQTDGWFEIDLSANRTERGCLSHIVGQGGKFIFTNYQGEKIAERSAIGLAMALRNDSIRPLDDAPLFDRMIDTLVNNIGRDTRAAAR